MSASVVSPTTTIPSIADLFEAKVTQVAAKRKVSYSDIKVLLKNVSNSSEEITLEDYNRVKKATETLNTVLEKQNSKVIKRKSHLLHKAHNNVFNKLSDDTIKHSGSQGTKLPPPIEAVPKTKAIKQKEVIYLMKYFQIMKERVNLFTADPNKQCYLEISNKQYKELHSNIFSFINNINKHQNEITNSSYQHSPHKMNTLANLELQAKQLIRILQKNYSLQQSDNTSIRDSISTS